MSSRKKIIIAVILLFSLLIGVGGWLKLRTNSLNQKTQNIQLNPEVKRSAPQVSVIVDNKFWQINDKKTSQEAFQQIFQLLNFQQRNWQFLVLGTDQFVTPKNIVFRFTNIENLSEQDKSTLFEPFVKREVTLRGTTAEYNSNSQTLTYIIYDNLNTYLVEKFSSEDITNIWQNIIFRTLYRSSLPNGIDKQLEQEYLLLFEQFNLLKQNQTLFSLNETLSALIKNALAQLKQGIVKPVYAGCSQTHACGKNVYDCDCSTGSAAYDLQCSGPTDVCGPLNEYGVPSGTCNCTTVCQDCSTALCGQKPCDGSTQDSCINTGCLDCKLTDCTWKSSAPPPPGATPPPTCGNGYCGDPGEDCNTCPIDCGGCAPAPTPDPCAGVNCTWYCGDDAGNCPSGTRKIGAPDGMCTGPNICQDERCGPPTNCENPIPPPPPCPALSTPVNLSSSCDYSGAAPVMSLAWSAVADADFYPLRVDADPSSFNTACTPPNVDDYCGDVATNNFQFTTGGGTVYAWWVHAANNCGNYSGANSQVMGCADCPSNVTVTCGNPDFDPSYPGGIGIQATVSWTSAPAGVDLYNVRLNNDPTNFAQCLAGDGITPVDWFCTGFDQFLVGYDANVWDSAENNTLSAYVLPNTDYNVTVQSKFSVLDAAYYNTGCQAPAVTFSCPYTDIEGMVYVDNGAATLSGGRCINGGTTLPSFDFEEVTIQNSPFFYHSTTVNNHYYSDANPDLPYITAADSVKNNVTLHINNSVGGDTAYACSCPNNGDSYNCTLFDVLSPELDVNFFVREYDISNPAWFQTFGANIYANSSIISFIPQQCIDYPVCGSALSLPDAYNTVNSPGFPLHLAGSLQTFENPTESYIHKSAITRPDAFGANTNEVLLDEYNYSYYLEKISSTTGYTIQNINSEDDLHTSVVEDGDLHILQTPNTGLTIGTSLIEVKNNTKVIVLVDGDLNVENPNTLNQLVKVENGSYAAFIMKDSLNVAPEVGYPVASYVPYDGTPATSQPNLEGVYLADYDINIQSFGDTTDQDRKFVGAGTFVGWGGVSLDRNFGNNSADPVSQAINNLNATEAFYYRPDLVINAPNIMNETFQSWQLSAPTWQE